MTPLLECGGKALRDAALDSWRDSACLNLSKAASRKALPPHSKFRDPKFAPLISHSLKPAQVLTRLIERLHG